jgi:hypothetical protein
MDKILFQGPASVYLQGENALHVKGQYPNYWEFALGGFVHIPVTIRDFRPASLTAMQYVTETQDVTHFADIFCSPARVLLFKLGQGGYLVKLLPTAESDQRRCQYVLWMPVGLEDYLPVYNYIFDELVAIDDQRFAGLLLYRRPGRWKRERSSKIVKARPWNAGRGLARRHGANHEVRDLYAIVA